MMRDLDLIQRLLQRDERALDELLATYTPLMRYIIAPIITSPEEAEECLADVALRVWEKISQFDSARGNFRTWLTAITRNTAVDRARASAHTPHTTALELAEQDHLPSVEEDFVRKEQAAALRAALSQLAHTEQALFYRKYYYLQSTAQIAAELGCSERAVEGKLYRIKKKLQKALGGVFDAQN